MEVVADIDEKVAVAKPAPAPISSVEIESNQTLSKTTQSRLQTLQDLRTRIQALRPLPAQLLRSQSAPGSILESNPQALDVFRTIGEIGVHLKKDDVQDALRTAMQSKKSGRPDVSLSLDWGTSSGKRRKVATPDTLSDSPGQYPLIHQKHAYIFPKIQDISYTSLKAGDLPAYIRQHNEKNNITKIHIWAPKRDKNPTPLELLDPIILRVTLRDIGMTFIKLGKNADRTIFVESVAAIGPREKAGPYGHSEFTVYQKLSQQIARMVECEPGVSIPQLVDLISSYKDMFIGQCAVCGRILSLEGHTPAVGRIWRDTNAEDNNNKQDRGFWEARHISCMQN